MIHLLIQANERVIVSHDWITAIFVLCLLILFLLKLFNAEKMKGYALSIFNRGFIEISAQEKKPFLGIFDLSFLFFSFLNISLSSYFLLNHGQGKCMFSFLEFSQVASYILVYILGRIIVENLLLNLFQITEQLSYFFISKRVYLCSISIGIFFLNLCCFYGFEKTKGDFTWIVLLSLGIAALFLVRFVIILIYNKNLILKELFYFILYLCAFEIVPLMVVLKLMI